MHKNINRVAFRKQIPISQRSHGKTGANWQQPRK